MFDLQSLWEHLDMSGDSTGGFVRLRIIEVTACAAYAARSVTSGLNAFIVELTTSQLPPDMSLPSAVGVQLISEALTPGRSGRTRVILALTRRTFEREYRIFVNDVAVRLAMASSERAAAQILHDTFHRWLRFLRQRAGDELSRERRIGLIGELIFLLQLMDRIAPDAALSAWKGCEGNHHDFALANCAVEVKSTVQSDASAFRVSNISQLEPPRHRPLFVFHVHLRTSASGNFALADQVQEVANRLPIGLTSKYENALMSCGYHPDLNEEATEERFELVSERFFCVDDGFPRIARSTVPNGVEGVTYSVALSACSAFEISANTAWDELGRVEDGSHG